MRTALADAIKMKRADPTIAEPHVSNRASAAVSRSSEVVIDGMTEGSVEIASLFQKRLQAQLAATREIMGARTPWHLVQVQVQFWQGAVDDYAGGWRAMSNISARKWQSSWRVINTFLSGAT